MVEGGTYRHLMTPEKKMFYGKSAYPALPDILRQEQPDIIVMGWPYFLQIFFQPRLRNAMKTCGTRPVIREIPFQTPPYGRIKEYFRTNPMYDESMRLMSRGTAFYLRQWFTAKVRKYCYAQVAGTLNYSTAAYDILPSYGVKRNRYTLLTTLPTPKHCYARKKPYWLPRRYCRNRKDGCCISDVW